MRIFCFTSDKYLWAVRGFINQMQKYWLGIDTVIVGFSEPDFDLPRSFEFHSLGNFEDYPAERWSDAAIKFLRNVDDDLFVLMLEDYWITRKVDDKTMQLLEWYMGRYQDIACIDLTTDRLYGANARDYHTLHTIDLIINDPPAPYHMSLQARIWRRTEFLKYLVPGETPWQVELEGTRRMVEDRALVLGTRQIPLRYLIAVQNGKVAFDGGYQVPPPYMSEEDKHELIKLLPKEKEIA